MSKIVDFIKGVICVLALFCWLVILHISYPLYRLIEYLLDEKKEIKALSLREYLTKVFP